MRVTGEDDSGASEATGCGKPKGHIDSIRQHASACVSIYVSIRQHTWGAPKDQTDRLPSDPPETNNGRHGCAASACAPCEDDKFARPVDKFVMPVNIPLPFVTPTEEAAPSHSRPSEPPPTPPARPPPPPPLDMSRYAAKGEYADRLLLDLVTPT
jgi:hypothetical protein